mmetsp:Transcript_314/g.585  ORF Transcript_314/g.585 Transcript_314/m.585 type:complete len:98 (-) Transcript_314:1333-1626(-)
MWALPSMSPLFTAWADAHHPILPHKLRLCVITPRHSSKRERASTASLSTASTPPQLEEIAAAQRPPLHENPSSKLQGLRGASHNEDSHTRGLSAAHA